MARTAAAELAEVDRHCKLEQQGVPLTKYILRTGQSGIRYPAEPFQRWLDARLDELRRDGVRDPVAAYARSLGCAQKRLTDWRTAETVDESSVDRAVTRDGRYTLHDIYPAPRVAYAAAMFWSAQAEPRAGAEVRNLVTVDVCARPGCDEERDGGRFCPEHQEEMLRIRCEFEADGALMSANGGASRSASKKRRSTEPSCCNPACWYPRLAGERFCSSCQAEGWIEDDEEIRQLEVLT